MTHPRQRLLHGRPAVPPSPRHLRTLASAAASRVSLRLCDRYPFRPSIPVLLRYRVPSSRIQRRLRLRLRLRLRPHDRVSAPTSTHPCPRAPKRHHSYTGRKSGQKPSATNTSARVVVIGTSTLPRVLGCTCEIAGHLGTRIRPPHKGTWGPKTGPKGPSSFTALLRP